VTFSTAAVTAPPTRGPVAGMAVQFLLIAALGLTTGLSVAGWLAGAAYALVLWIALSSGLQRTGMSRLGPANVVTLGRASLVAGVTALVVTSIARPVPTAVLVSLVGVALALDGVDGQVARRTGSTSALGARFDMEIDAFLILVLSVYIGGAFGWWTVAMGAFRYAFVAASWLMPWLSAPLPPRFSRKVVAAVQGIVLVVATAHQLPYGLTLALVAAALAALTWSFGSDIGWLWRIEQARSAAAVERTARRQAFAVVARKVPATVS
jgi:phosphatidylglycerophosphate synthase